MTSRLTIERAPARSVVTAMRSTAPLRLLAPRGGGHAVWVYQSSLGGGFVGADDVALGVEVGAGAALFLSTQASTKVYRATAARFELTARVAAGATLVAWPDPIACFAGASLDQVQRFDVAPDASLLVVDGWTAGRVARGERWQLARLATRLVVNDFVDDAMLLDPAHGDLGARLGGMDAFATVIATGRFGPGGDAIATRPLSRTPIVSASRWPWGTIVRVAARDAAGLTAELRELLGASVIDALGADPWARKW
jgi:urease accessory protein